jgi:hypothetical protein
MAKKIRTATIKRHNYFHSEQGEELSTEEKLVSYTEFNEKGNIIKEIKYNGNGEVEEKYAIVYDANDNLAEEVFFIDDNEIAEQNKYIRDDQGKVLKVLKHYIDGAQDTAIYQHDRDGRVVEITVTDPDGETESREVFVYNHDRMVLKELFEYDEPVLKETFAYDDKGNLVENTRLEKDKKLVRYLNEYNDKGKLIKSLTFNEKDKLIEKTSYHLDDLDRVTRIAFENPFESTTTSIEYDVIGNAVSQTETGPGERINHKVIRTFNENNDLVSSEVYIDHHGRTINEHYMYEYFYEYF